MTHYRKLPLADERIHGQPVIYCVAASGVNIARAADNGRTPATDAEVLALRAATGDTEGGESLDALQHGMNVRYGYLTVLDESWETIVTGLASGNRWFVIVGWLHRLPGRLWTQDTDVFHAIAFGPDNGRRAVLVDPLQQPTPTYRYVTFDEMRPFAQSGGFSSLSILEYAHAARVGHVTKRGAFWPYHRSAAGVWSRPRLPRVTRGLSADTTLRRSFVDVCGKTRRMAQITTGFLAGTWVDTAQFEYTEELA